jgi:DegV family protein with EDD domain
VAGAGGDIEAVRTAALAAVERVSTLFYVDTLEFLRRGGRITAAQALLGTALAVKPILHVVRGEVVLKEKVRTSSRALARLADLAVEAAQESDVDIAVQHLGAPDRAQALHDTLLDRLGDRVHDRYLSEVGAAIAAHTGPGVIGVTVYRRV